MSGFDNNNNFSGGEYGTTTTGMRPEHHIHDTSEPLPGARGGNAAASADYSTSNIENNFEGRHNATSGGNFEGGFDQGRRMESELPQGQREGAYRGGYQSETRDLDNGRGAGGNLPRSGDAYEGGYQGESRALDERTDELAGGMERGSEFGGSEPHGKPKMTDKVIGGAEKTMGKMMKKPQMEEKGAVRASEGKAAMQERF